MEYINKTTQDIYTIETLREAFPNVYVGNNPSAEYLEALDIAIVGNLTPPDVGDYQTAVRDGVEFVGGEWRAVWTVLDWANEDIDAAIQQAKAVKWEQIKAERDRREFLGVKVGTDWFHTDVTSQLKQLGLKDRARDALAAGGATTDVLQLLGQPIVWKLLDGSWKPITVQLAFDIVAKVGELQGTLFAVAQSHKTAMEMSTDPSTYDFSSGWPETFAG